MKAKLQKDVRKVFHEDEKKMDEDDLVACKVLLSA